MLSILSILGLENIYPSKHFLKQSVNLLPQVRDLFLYSDWLKMEIYGVNLRIHSKCKKIRTRKNSVFVHFSRSADCRTENMVSIKEVWLWNEFESFVVFSTIKLKDEVNFFIRAFLEVFYFLRSFIVVIESFKRNFCKVLVLNKCFTGNYVHNIIRLYILP